MQGINNFFNEPIMIEHSFMINVLSQLALSFKNGSFQNQDRINENYFNKINTQLSSFTDAGVNRFPVVVDIIGPIIKYSDWYYTGTQTILQVMKELENDDRVSGVLLNLDSGGGMGDGTRELANYIFNMKTPTIGYSGGLVCSAALYLFAACKYRVASPHASWLGSLGTYIPYANYDGILEKFGAMMKDIYATESSLKNFAWREMVDNQNSIPFEEMANAFNSEFIADMKSFYRDQLQDDGKVFKGDLYRPKEALSIGLVQQLCSKEEALQLF
ncbi:S49 family peptidase [Chryseobacterium sp.]|uniref:S49 family peptidase n=1 Tax=Chryseobacterium sp. TaxID=1871047 RepID=UPI00261A301B|nr:S49 family peptidase [Chryseobacterium sp.]